MWHGLVALPHGRGEISAPLQGKAPPPLHGGFTAAPWHFPAASRQAGSQRTPRREKHTGARLGATPPVGLPADRLCQTRSLCPLPAHRCCHVVWSHQREQHYAGSLLALQSEVLRQRNREKGMAEECVQKAKYTDPGYRQLALIFFQTLQVKCWQEKSCVTGFGLVSSTQRASGGGCGRHASTGSLGSQHLCMTPPRDAQARGPGRHTLSQRHETKQTKMVLMFRQNVQTILLCSHCSEKCSLLFQSVIITVFILSLD